MMFLKARSIGLLICLFWATISCLTNTSDPTQAIGITMQTGAAQQLASYFDTELDLRIDPMSIDFQSVPASQAELIMSSFFRKYPARQFQTVEQGSTTNLWYTTGTYQTEIRSFRVNVLLRQVTPGQYRIHAIQVNE